MMTHIRVLIFLILAGLALYWTPLHSASFYFDDRSALVNNEAIKHIDLPQIFHAFNSRSLVGLSFALNYRCCGLDPFGFRLVNLLIHGLNAFLVYMLLRFTLPLRPPWPAVFGAFLFLSHPIQTEAVNSITQRFVLMGTFFYLASLYFYICHRQKYSGEVHPYFCSLITAVAGMFCKEFVFTLPLMLSLYEFTFVEAPQESMGHRWRRLAPFFIIALIVPLVLLRTPHDTVRAANIAADSGEHIDITRAKNAISRHDYFLTELNVVRTYVRLLFLPINQNFDYDYPISKTLDIRTLFSGLFLLCLLGLTVLTYRSFKMVSFGILWFFIALSVESSVIPIGHVIAEYRLYLASVGFIFLIVYGVYAWPKDIRKSQMIAVGILICTAFLTYQRNQVWKDEFSLWNDTVHKSPHKARPYLDRGLEYFAQGKYPEAMADFNMTIQLDARSAAAYNDLGVLYGLKGDYAQALLDFNQAIAINPDYTDAYKNRALTYARLKTP